MFLLKSNLNLRYTGPLSVTLFSQTSSEQIKTKIWVLFLLKNEINVLANSKASG